MIRSRIALLFCEGGVDVVGVVTPRSSTGFPWRSGCRAQSTARSAGGGRKRRRQRRTGGSRKGEANQGDAHMGDYGDEMTRLRT